MPWQVHAQQGILEDVLAKVLKKIDSGRAEETDGQMHGVLGGHCSGVRLAPWDKEHISGCHLDLLVRNNTRIDLCLTNYFERIGHLRVPDAPVLVSVNLHDQDV